MYVPVLKIKQGELAALKGLSEEIAPLVCPLLESLPLKPRKPRVTKPGSDAKPKKKQIPEQDKPLHAFAARLIDSWFRERPLFLDMAGLSSATKTSDGLPALSWLFEHLDEAGIRAVPVWRTDVNHEVSQLMVSVARDRRRGVCLRVPKAVFLSASALPAIRRDVQAFGLENSQVDLVLDLFRLTEGELVTYRDLMSLIIGRIPDVANYRSLTLACGAFPDSSAFNGSGFYELPRRDWILWSHLAEQQDQMIRMPDFGDYATILPRLEEPPSRPMKPSAGIKYTTSDSWLVSRGTSVLGREGYEQYRSLARQIIEHKKYCGEQHCAGDAKIVECASGACDPGTPASWIAPVVNHHITFAARQVASQGVASS